jgi:hypothetical protein
VTRALRICYAILGGFLLVFAFALSFGALRHRAVEAHIIHGDLATVLWGGLSVHTQAGIWALCPDVLAVVGIIGIRIDRRDPRAWAALVLGLGLTLTFQVWEDPWTPLLRAVPALAGAMAVWMIEVPWAKPSRMPDPVAVAAPAPGPAQSPAHLADLAGLATAGDGRVGGGGTSRPATPARPTKTKAAERQAAYRARKKEQAALTPSQNGDGPHA